jgi:hypothetical protein
MTIRAEHCVVLGLLLASCVGEIPLPSGPSRPGPVPGTDLDPGVSRPDNQPTTSDFVRLRRLTPEQYQNSVRDLLGVELDVAQLTAIPPLHGLEAIGASSIALPERDIEVFGTLAESASAALFDDAERRDQLVGCDGSQLECARQFVTAFGRRVFRRPLAGDERERYLALLDEARAATEGDGWLALRVVVGALLQSPHFLYRAELGEPDPEDATRRKLTSHELASRLSFFLWNSTPDEALLAAADRGDPALLADEAERLLASPRAGDAAEQLFSDYLRLSALDHLEKLPDAFPQLTPTLPLAMKRETLLTLRALLFEERRPFRDVFTSTDTFVDAELAALYDVSLPDGVSGFAAVALPADGPRAGLLMQASFLATHAHPGTTSPTRRGKFIRESLLCHGIPPPPDDVDTSLDQGSGGGLTQRERLARHAEDVTCAGCHKLMDPLGLSLESFDALGAYRETDHGLALDTRGELDGAQFDDARGLAEALAEHPDTASCIVRTVLRYARGTLETRDEEALIEALGSNFEAAGQRVPDLMLDIAKNAAFGRVGAL